MPIRGLILVAIFVASLPVCFARPFYGLLLWTIVAFLNPQSFTWGAAEMFPWAMAVAIPTMVGMLIWGWSWSALNVREAYLIGILWAWFGITTLVSTSTPLFMHHAADTWYRLSFVSKILLMTMAMFPIVNSLERLRWLVMVMAACFGFFVAKAFPFIVATGGAHRIFGPDRSMIADNNDFGLALNMTLPLFFFLAHTEENRWIRMGSGALFLMTIPCIFFTYSRGALIGLLAVTAALFTFIPLRQRFLLVPVIAAGVTLAVLFAPESWKNRMDPTREGAVDASANARLNAWQFCRNLAADYPMTGGGFNTFTPELYARFYPSMRAIGPHSVYFQLLAEHGYIGLVLYLTLVGSTLLTARKIIRKAKLRGDYVVRQYARMFQLSLIGFLAPGFFLGRAYFDYFFTIVACVAILGRVAEKQWACEDAETAEEDEAEESVDEAGRRGSPVWRYA